MNTSPGKGEGGQGGRGEERKENGGGVSSFPLARLAFLLPSFPLTLSLFFFFLLLPLPFPSPVPHCHPFYRESSAVFLVCLSIPEASTFRFFLISFPSWITCLDFSHSFAPFSRPQLFISCFEICSYSFFFFSSPPFFYCIHSLH